MGSGGSHRLCSGISLVTGLGPWPGKVGEPEVTKEAEGPGCSGTGWGCKRESGLGPILSWVVSPRMYVLPRTSEYHLSWK